MATGSPLRRDAEANRTRLVSAAVDVFNSEGIDAGVELIAQRAGVGIGTLYRRFPTKDALIECLVEQTLQDMTEAAVEAGTVPDGGGLEHFVRAIAGQMVAHRGYLGRLWKHGSAPDSSVQQLRRHIEGLVAAARDSGSVAADVTRADITTLIWALQGVIDNAGDDAADACDRLVSVAFAGLAQPRV